MPANLEVFAEDELKMRYKEPYLTAPLNQKFAVNTARGVYRGFKLEADGILQNTVNVISDAVVGDHALVYENRDGYSLTVRRTSGDFSFNLDSYVDPMDDTTWIIAVYADYRLGVTTSAELRIYSDSEYDSALEAPDLVVLGTVVIPAASGSPLPAGNVTASNRTFPWLNLPPSARDKRLQVRNPNFALALSDGEPNYWTLDVEFSKPTASQLDFTGGAGPLNSTAYQSLGVEVRTGDQIKGFLRYQVSAVPVSGSLYVDLVWKASDDVEITTSRELAMVELTPVVDVDFTTRVPSGAVLLDRVALRVVNGIWSGTPIALTFYEVQVYGQEDSPPRARGSLELENLRLLGVSQDYNAVAEDYYRVRTIARDADSTRIVRIMESMNQSVGHAHRMSVDGSSGELFLTSNAKYNNASGLWEKDDNSSDAYAVTMGGSLSATVPAFRFGRVPDTKDTWSDWDEALASGDPSAVSVATEEGYNGTHFKWGDQAGVDLRPGAGNIGKPGRNLLNFRTLDGGTIGRSRYHIDWLGLPPGRLRKFDHNWPDPVTADFGAAANYSTAASEFWVGRELTLQANNAQSYVLSSWGFRSSFDTIAFSMTWQASLENVGTYYWGGLSSSLNFGDGSTSRGIWFQALGGNFYAYSGQVNGSPNLTDSGITPVADQVYAFRIDFVGKGFDAGWAAYFYIDGAQVAAHTTEPLQLNNSFPTNYYYGFRGNNTVVTGNYALRISPASFMYYLPSPQSTTGDMRWEPED